METSEQGSPAWHAARLGKVTSSNAGKAMSKGRGSSPSQTAVSYMRQLICERLSGKPTEVPPNKYIDHGNEYEATARDLYSFWNQDVTECGFIPHPTILWCGGSPDGLVGDDGTIEIKCPYTLEKHFATIEEDRVVDPNYLWQCHSHIWVTNRQWCDFVSFHPDAPDELQLHVVRVERDEDKIDDLNTRIPQFLGQVEERISKVKSNIKRGGFLNGEIS